MAPFRPSLCIALSACALVACATDARAGGVPLRGGGAQQPRSSSSAAATSQTSTTATDANSQSVQNGAAVQKAQTSFNRSLQALQALQKAQASARGSAISGANNLGLDPNHPGQTLPNVPDGLGAGGLMPTGGLTQKSGGSAIQVVQLGDNGSGVLSLGNGGVVTLPKGTPGNDTVSVVGAGSITSAAGSITAHAGSVTTQAGGTLSTTVGGAIGVTGGTSTLSVVSATSLTSSVAATVTLPQGGGQVAVAAGQAVTIPAGSTISFSGTSAGTVNIASSSSASTVKLTGAGTLSLTSSNSAGTGGTITTNSGSVSFTDGISTTLPAGATINLNGAGSINFAGGTSGAIPVIVPNSTNFTTTGALLNTTGYNVPGSWTNIESLSQSSDPTTQKITDTIKQSGQQALLYWDSFNIGKNTTLSFDQSAGGANVGQWVAINQITDASLRPSQILGAIEAPGQVYVLNQNGIIFGGSSQVYVRGLTASSLALNPDYLNSGLLNNSGNDFEFQFSSLVLSTTALVGPRGHKVLTTTVEPLWTAPPTVPVGGTQTISSVRAGDITVQAGAQLSAPTNAENQGGRIALIAPNVTNAGTIATPDGQTILAAGLQVGLAAHNANDASLRGLDVYVGKVEADAGTLPVGDFTFNGLPTGNTLTFDGSGAVGTFTTSDGTINTINGGAPVTIPIGSTVNITSGAPTFAAVHAGVVTNAASTRDASGNIVTPGGDIEAARADVTVAGAQVNQLGIINSSTSVTLNGRIDLLADFNAAAETVSGQTAFYPFATGDVNMGGDSVTQILPELSSTETTIGTRLGVASLVNVQGANINMLGGALLLAPGADRPSASSSAALDLSGATLTSGVTFNAGTWFSIGNDFGISPSTFSNSAGSINLGNGAVIDVSGSENVAASVAENIIPVELRGPELANSPVQRDGSLRGATVYIDIRNAGVSNGQSWIGTPIGDVSGYVNDVQRTVGELTTDGGTVALNAGASVSANAGAAINVSGGWINYAGANVQTTKILSNGQVIDISQATPNIAYQGIYNGFSTTSKKWGVTQTFINSILNSSQYEAGYQQGGNGGKISISAPSMSLGGDFYGNTIAGTYQRASQSALNSTYTGANFLPTSLMILGLPQSSELDLSFLQNKVGLAQNVYQTTSPDVVFQTSAFISQNAPAANQMFLSQDIVNVNGFGKLSIDTSASGSILVPEGVALTTAPGGMINFSAANIDIEGSIAVPGGGADGGMKFTVSDISPTTTGIFSTPAADPTRGHFVLGANASLTSSGLIVDDRATVASPDTLPFLTAGGSISIAALNVDLKSGSTIDVSGGVSVNASGKSAFGNAGNISILGGEDPLITSLVDGGRLILGATMTGYSGNAGGAGSLTVQAPLVQIGGASLLNGDNSATAFTQGEVGVTSNGTTLWLNSANGGTADFFSQGGFGTFNIEGLGAIQKDLNGSFVFSAAGNPVISPAVLIAANTLIKPVVQNYSVALNASGLALTPLTPTQAAQQLASQRTAANLTFDAEGVSSNFSSDGPPLHGGGIYQNSAGGGGVIVRGDLVMQAGAKIVTDPQVNASHGVSLLAGHGTVAVLGGVYAPGGAINIKGGNTSSFSSNQLLFYQSTPNQPFATVDLGPTSVLSTAGATEQTVNSLGYRTGSVLAGGSIVIGGNIVAESGATLDVSGASDVLAISAASLGYEAHSLSSLTPVLTRIDSNAGSITFNASQLLYSDATLLGKAGGPNAQGGSLAISSGFAATTDPNVLPPTPADVTLIVMQAGLNGGFSLPTGGATGLGLLDGDALPGSASAVGATINSAIGGEPVDSYFAANTNLFSSTALDGALANNGGKAGGFASLNLGGTLDFLGPVKITTSRSLSLAKSSGNATTGETGGVIYADSNVVLTAPYVALNIDQTSFTPDLVTPASYPLATAGTGNLTINAARLADVGNLSLQNISTFSFNAGTAVAGDIRGNGTLQVGGAINMNATQIYPTTAQTFTITANDVSITTPVGQPLPSLPLSGGGTLNIFANTIEQAGVLRAPFGIINLGNGTTQGVTLAAGSVTSVSGVDPTTGKGITLPYGIVNDNGIWYDPNGKDISLTGPPAKEVNIAGQNVQVLAGSTVDVTGGGELYGYQFTAGVGGNKDILASLGNSLSSNSFAIVPTYSLGYAYAPVETFAQSNNLFTNGVQDAGYFNSSLAAGEQVYLNASNGLAAGNYTLLPARYVLMPGAFLISASSSGAPGASVVQADGSSLVSGYITSGFNPTTSPLFNGFQVYSQAAVLARAPYTIDTASLYFPKSAANHNLITPRLPNDAGQLVLNASQAMTIQGTLLSQAAQGGLGGEVDIASSEDIYITGPNASAVPAGALVLDSSQLTNFGAASLLIGGYRTSTTQGTAVTVTTNNLVVDNAGVSLASPDVILASNANLTVVDGASISQLGQLSGAAKTLTLQGNGALLRVSSDPGARVVRQGVIAGDTTSNLSIGRGVHILNADGTAAGALTLDSTSQIQISASSSAPPVLMSKSLTLDSALINLELGTPVTAPTSGLVITEPQLTSLLSSTQSLSLLSYSSIAIYGSGEIGSVAVDATGKKTYQEANLALHANDIYYADTQNSAGITINAQSVTLDNLSGGTALPTLGGLGTSNLTVNAQTITIGSNVMRMDQFTDVALNADSAVLLDGLGAKTVGSTAAPTAAGLNVSGNLTLTTPLITSAAKADQPVSDSTTATIDVAINASGALVLQAPAVASTTLPNPGALAANLALSGSSVTQDSGSILLHSGAIALQATTGDVNIGGKLDVSGVAADFFNLTKYTDGGQVTLSSLGGNVSVSSTGLINVSAASGAGTADSGAGNGGSLKVNGAGAFVPGQVQGAGGQVTQAGAVIAQGAGGTFTLDVGTLNSGGAGSAILSTLESGLTGFASQAIRDRNDSTVTIDGMVKASNFNISADKGSIVVAGTVDASNVQAGGTGGNISLQAGGGVTTQAGSMLTVAANQLNHAGQGGSVSLEAGAYEGSQNTSAAISLAGQIDLSVAGGTGGTLHLRAPQVASGNTPVAVNEAGGGSPTDVAIAPISSGLIHHASSIVVEGFYVQDAQQTNAMIGDYEGNAQSNAAAFMSNAGSIGSRLFGPSLANVHVRAGEEIDNSQGSLELQSTWDLSTLRYGAPLLDGQGNAVVNAIGNPVLSEPGVLTIRAAGNINLDFGASITDGFDGSAGVGYQNMLLPVGSQSWSYRIASGADFSAANSGAVQTAAQLQASGLGGSVQVGYQNTSAPILLSNFSANNQATFFQTIRSGTGDITITAGGDVLLLNNLATIYTAGSQVDGTLGGTFAVPAGTDRNGAPIPATYSTGGGNVLITAQGNIAHETYSPDGSTLVADSSAELPTNWLDREGSVNGSQVTLPTTWWVDFTNFFEGVGALGGGNVTLTAGGSVANIDASVPTNARLVNGQLTELGGGDLVVRAGGEIDAGVYYVERGDGSLSAGGNIESNSTRAAVALGQPSTSQDWLPTTLFVGKGNFSVAAGGDLLLGPVVNPFLLPQSFNNIASTTDFTSEISYFSTYAATDEVNASSLVGGVTVRAFADGGGQGSLYAWYANVLDELATSPSPGAQISGAQPWLLLAEATVPQRVRSFFGPASVLPPGSPSNSFDGVTALMPSTLRVTSFSGDINLIGSLTLSPSPKGTLDLAAAGSIKAFDVNQVTVAGVTTSQFGSGLINISDADPSALPGIASPLSLGTQLANLNSFFTPTGATEGLTLQIKQELHGSIDGASLHAGDPNSAYVYALNGNISGLTLFSPKQTEVVAGQDITDIGLYLQNNTAADVSLVSAGRDIIAYDAASQLRQLAGNNLLGFAADVNPVGAGAGAPNSGDIQIAGPGTLEVLAGRDLTLGNDAGQNPNHTATGDGLFTGLTSVGGQANLALPFGGANIIAAAGLGGGIPPAGLAQGSGAFDFTSFITQFLDPSSTTSSRYLADLMPSLGLNNATDAQIWAAFQNLPAARQDALALDVFYLVLRDAGRDHNDPGTPGFGNYNAANQAIAALFPKSHTYQGNIDLTSREIKTSNGGDLNLLTPGGQVIVGVEAAGGQAVDQGILTVDGGDISIFANGDVSVGTSRIFTLHGGHEVIFSTTGNIDAGASSKTVVSAPPTRVVVDPTSGSVQTDLAGLATGGGIGVLASVPGTPPSDVDLIAPAGTINAGDAGIRATGNLNISALKVLNADNISVGGKSTGVPATASVNIGAVTAASSAAGSSTAAAQAGNPNKQNGNNTAQDLPSIITVEILGYGGGEG